MHLKVLKVTKGYILKPFLRTLFISNWATFYRFISSKGSGGDYRERINLAMLGLETLKDRRDHIAEKFAIKVLKHEDHRKMFQFSESDRTRAGKKVLVSWARTSRYARSTVPSLARMINEKFVNKI